VLLVDKALRSDVVGLDVEQDFSPASSRGRSKDLPYISLIAVGKAAHGMGAAAARILGPRVGRGLVIAPSPVGPSSVDERNPAKAGSHNMDVGSPHMDVGSDFSRTCSVVLAGHPAPTAASEDAGRKALAIAESLRDDEILLVLLSGGASALMAVPAEGLTLSNKIQTTDTLLRAGADIHALNAVRKHVSAVKGGRLAAAARGRTFTLAISDVVGDDLSVIGSGPTIGDPTTFADALNVLARYGARDGCPARVISHLERGARGDIAETPKPGDSRLRRSEAAVIGRRHDAMAGAASQARSLGYSVEIIEPPVVGEARLAGRERVAAALAANAGRSGRRCVISSGETTVRVTGTGRGGRNQEFALAAADLVHSFAGAIALASVGTDGIDGPTDAAGALVDSTTIPRARESGLSPDSFLHNNDAYAFFQAIGDLIHTGPTGTNVGDLQVILLA
jgi:glycerate 2-kinase